MIACFSKWKYILLFILLSGNISIITSCKNKEAKPPAALDTPVAGRIRIVADESFAPLLRQEIITFTDIYKDAVIDARYLPELKVTHEFFSSDENRLMIIARRLNNDEKPYFVQLGLTPREIKIAIDAVALVINATNTDTQLQYEQVADIINGKINVKK